MQRGTNEREGSMPRNRLRIWRTRISYAVTIGFGSLLVLTLIQPWLPLPSVFYALFFVAAILTGIAVIICTPGVFNQWQGFLGCLALLIPINIWMRVLPVIPIPISSRLISSISYFTLLLWILGFLGFPIALIRLLWRHDLTCLITALFLPVPLWTLLLLIWRVDDTQALMDGTVPLESQVFWATIIGIPPLLLSTAVGMFVVNLVRLLWHEGSDPSLQSG